MKVYILGQKGIPAHGGGVERHVEELAKELVKQGQEVFVYARKKYTPAELQRYQGATILHTPAIYTKHLEAISHTFFSVLDLLRRKADIVHVHSIGPSLLIPMIRILKPRTRVVSTIHSPDYFHQKWNAFARFALRLGERIAATFAHDSITVSKTLHKHVHQTYGVKTHPIPNGVVLPKLGTDPAVLNQWGLEPNEYIVSVSRLVRHKGLHLLIDAYKQIAPTKKLVIVGGAEYTDEYVNELKAMAAGNPNIIFTGKQSGVVLQALFEHAYLFVQPSLSEGLSIALLEAFAHRQTVLASDISENQEVTKGIGFDFIAGDREDLAKKLAFLLANPLMVKNRKELGRQHVAKQFDWTSITHKTVRVYRALLTQRDVKRAHRVIAKATIAR